jgi:hypothetical protein
MTHLIDKNSTPSGKAELEMFSLPPTQVAVKEEFWVELNPLNAVNSTGPYEFYMPGDMYFLDLAKNYVYVKLRIRTAAGANLTWDPAANQPNEADRVGPIQLIGKTMFKQVKLFLGGKLAYDSGDVYHYRSYLETILNADEEEKRTILRAAGYQKDTPVDHVNDAANTGWLERALWFRESRAVEFMAPITCELCNQDKFLIPRVDLRLELTRNSSPFSLLHMGPPPQGGGDPQFNLEVTGMKWFVKKVNPTEAISLALESALLRNTVKYPVRRIEIKTLHIAAGRRDTPTNNLFYGQIPRRLVVGMVANDAFHGTITTNPFGFKPFSARTIQVQAGGKSYPPNPLTFDFARDNFARAYVQMYEDLGLTDTRKTNGITPDEFKAFNCLFVFNLCPDEPTTDNWQLVQDGATSVSIHFRDNVPNGGVRLICMAEFDGLISIDRFRHVFFDWTP